jgi:predicted 3-demethylubiquinone-9 3-methyltransferase (glyoxalase superfamily)
MRTNIEIDDRLMAHAIKLSGLPTKRAAVEAGQFRLDRFLQRKSRLRRASSCHSWATSHCSSATSSYVKSCRARALKAETDRLWNAIVSNGGQESMCGWCKDRWGFSWQITPRALLAATQDPDLLFLPTRDNRPVSLRQFVHLLYVIV